MAEGEEEEDELDIVRVNVPETIESVAEVPTDDMVARACSWMSTDPIASGKGVYCQWMGDKSRSEDGLIKVISESLESGVARNGDQKREN